MAWTRLHNKDRFWLGSLARHLRLLTLIEVAYSSPQGVIPDWVPAHSGHGALTFQEVYHEKKSTTLSLLFVVMMSATAPAAASDLAGFLIGLAFNAVEKAGSAVVDTVKDSIAKKETAEDRKVRENEQIEAAADEILAQYPPEEREARKPEVMMFLTKSKVESKVVEDRLTAIRDEQNSVGSFVADAAKSAIGSTVGSRSVFDSAARSAAFRVRF